MRRYVGEGGKDISEGHEVRKSRAQIGETQSIVYESDVKKATAWRIIKSIKQKNKTSLRL